MPYTNEIKSHGHFLLFLFIHAAYVDHDLHMKEIRYILDHMSSLFEPEEDIYEIFLDIKDSYQELSTAQVKQVIKENLDKYVKENSMGYHSMMQVLNEVIKADGIIQKSELKLMVNLKDWLSEKAATQN